VDRGPVFALRASPRQAEDGGKEIRKEEQKGGRKEDQKIIR